MASEPAQQVDSPADFGTDEAAKAARWISELELAEKNQNPWVTRCRQIIKRYEDERTESNDVKKRRFALLWANVQTLGPACYARTPTAVVSRRWKDGDPTGRVASEVIERALNFSLDAQDFAAMMVSLRDEYLLVARGQAWVRYVPHIRTVPGQPAQAPDGEITDTESAYDQVMWEEVLCDHVNWEDFGTNPARTWAEVRFVWRRAFMTRQELIDRFGEKKGRACPLDWKANAETGENDKDTQFAKAAIYEIWDKVSRAVVWINKSFSQAPLDERDDPLELKDFFPCPRPLLGTCGPNSIIPTPDYVYYESQAREINDLTVRIGYLTDALKVRGFYAGTENVKLQDLLAAETNTLVPIDNHQSLVDRGGLDKLVSWFPIDMVVAALKECIATRQQMLEDVFQITGIADIMRGDTDPNETAAAQQLKANWGSSRVRDKQNEISRFARDLLRIMGEVIATKFSAETLAKMTGVKLLPDQQTKQQLQMAAQGAQPQNPMQTASAAPAQQPQMSAPGQPAPPAPQLPPELMRMLNEPTWQEVEALLRDNTLRPFRVEVETDSTIEPNDQQEKQRMVEYVEAMGVALEKMTAIVAQLPEMLPYACETLKQLARTFRASRETEDILDEALDKLQQRAAAGPQQEQQQKPGPDPRIEAMKAQAAQTTAASRAMDAETNRFRAQTEAQEAKDAAQIEDARVVIQAHNDHAQRQADAALHSQDLAADLQQAAANAVTHSYRRDLANPDIIIPRPQGPPQ